MSGRLLLYTASVWSRKPGPTLVSGELEKFSDYLGSGIQGRVFMISPPSHGYGDQYPCKDITMLTLCYPTPMYRYPIMSACIAVYGYQTNQTNQPTILFYFWPHTRVSVSYIWGSFAVIYAPNSQWS